MITNIFGTAGVTLLLIAFILNLLRIIDEKSVIYSLLNFTGATLACISSVLIPFIPFIVLEGVWAIAALFPLIKKCKAATLNKL